MKVVYHTPDALKLMLANQHEVVNAHLAAADKAIKVADELLKAFEESLLRVRKGLPVGVTVDEPE